MPAGTKVLLGKGGSGAGAWEAWIEPIQGNNDSAGFSMHFPWADRRYPDQPKHFHWEQLEPDYLQRDGLYTLMDCLSWAPDSGLLLSGLADEDAATVRIELADQPRWWCRPSAATSPSRGSPSCRPRCRPAQRSTGW